MTQSTVRTPSRRDSRIPQVAKLSLSYVVLITDGCVRRTGSVDVSDHVQDQRRSYTVGSDLVSSRFLDGGLPDDIEHDFADAGSSVAAQQRARGGRARGAGARHGCTGGLCTSSARLSRKKRDVRRHHLHLAHPTDYLPHADLPDSRLPEVDRYFVGSYRSYCGGGIRGLLP